MRVVAIGAAAGDIREVFGTTCPVFTARHRWTRQLQLARGAAAVGDVVLLSPGCAGFDWYSRYPARGDGLRGPCGCSSADSRTDMAAAGTLVAERRRQVAQRTAATGQTLRPDARSNAVPRRRRRRRSDERSGRRSPRPSAHPTSYYVVATTVAVLTTLGLVMVLSASSVTSFHRGLSPWRYFSKQVMWSALGTIALVTTMRVPYLALAQLGDAVPGGLLRVDAPPVRARTRRAGGGARAWVQLGPIGFQPSEFLKLAVLLYCADVLTKHEDRMHIVRETLWPCLAVLVVSGTFMLAQGDLGSAVVLGALVLAVMFIGGARLIPLAGVAGALGLDRSCSS